MTRRMFTSTYTNLTSPLANGLSLTKISNALTLDLTRWEECISSILLAKFSVPTPKLRESSLALLTSKSLSQAESGLSQTELLHLQMLGKKELGTLLIASNTRCSTPAISQKSHSSTMHPSSSMEPVSPRATATNVWLIFHQVLTAASGLSTATRTKMVTPTFSNGIPSSEDGTVFQEPRVSRSVLSMKSPPLCLTLREESSSLLTLEVKNPLLTWHIILIQELNFRTLRFLKAILTKNGLKNCTPNSTLMLPFCIEPLEMAGMLLLSTK